MVSKKNLYRVSNQIHNKQQPSVCFCSKWVEQKITPFMQVGFSFNSTTEVASNHSEETVSTGFSQLIFRLSIKTFIYPSCLNVWSTCVVLSQFHELVISLVYSSTPLSEALKFYTKSSQPVLLFFGKWPPIFFRLHFFFPPSTDKAPLELGSNWA